MNSKQPPRDQKATLQYFQGEYHVVRPGGFVTCAVSEKKIPLADLRYWSADLQEAYASAQIATQRYADWKAGRVSAPAGEGEA